MAKQAIINSSPLIFLSKAGHLDLLRLVAEEILVPTPVIEEIYRRGYSDITAQALRNADWLQPIEVEPQLLIQSWDLGIGETGVLSYALFKPNVKAVIDDGLARKCALTHDIPVIGTLGIVLLAKKHGYRIL